MRIAICTPVYGDPKRRFTECLAELLIYTSKQAPELEITFQTRASSILPLSRTQLALGAIAWKADAILWLDADHTFPRDTLLRLLAHDLPVVGCNYPTRALPATPTARGLDGERLTAQDGPPIEVAGMGLGVCLVRISAFSDLPQPWFEMQMVDGPERYVGEDTHFFRLLGANGVKAFIDQKLSLQIGHLAETEVRFTG
jgi:hypothetical protein